MKTFGSVAILGACLMAGVGLAACGSDDPPAEKRDIQSLCSKGCATAASLHCPNDTSCSADCASQFSSLIPAACQDQGMAFAECAADSPADKWECAADGTSSLKAGQCSAQETALMTCMGFGGTDAGADAAP